MGKGLDMSTDVVFGWQQDIEIDGIKYCPDHLDRERYAQFLTEFLSHQDQEKPYVLNLNSGWGTGKTYFLKRWTEDLKTRHPVIYIDAWRDDHSDDPFMTVISAIISQLRAQTDKPDDSMFSKGISTGYSLLKAMGPLLLGAAAKKYLGKDIDELVSLHEPDSSGISKEVGDAAAKMAQFLISSHEKKNESVKALKAEIQAWIGAVIGQRSGLKQKPTFVIIDELDRCRPSFAVEMLEAVKHIFDIPGVFFIIATDTEQLQHAIKVVYGSGFDAQTYLSRFFDSRFSLRESPLIEFIGAHCVCDVFSKEYARKNTITLWPNYESPLENIVAIFDAFKLQPRTAIQIANKIASAIMYMKRGDSVDIVYLTILHCLRMRDPEIYNKVLGLAYLGRASDLFRGCDYFVSKSVVKVVEDISPHRVIIEVSLANYFSSIFQFICNVFEDLDGNCSILKRGASNEIEDWVRKDSRQHEKSITDATYHIKILQHEYINSQLRKKKKSYYKDLVELSASFD